MLQPAFYDYVFVLPFSLVLLFLTLGFFKNNTTSNLKKSISNDKKKIKTKITKKNYNFVYLKQILTLLFLLFLQNLLYRGYSETLWNNHLYINDFYVVVINFILMLAILIFFILYNLSITKLFFSVDFLYATSAVCVVLPLIFLSNTFFTFYFLLELTVCLIFYKFSVSRFWFRNPLKIYSANSLEKFSNNTPKAHINVLFFQYWISFFSSVLLLFFFINMEFYFNFIEWDFLNFLIVFLTNKKEFYLYFFIFIIGFFLKIGITPFHLYKLEIYKGLPFVTIFIYTIFFFTGYFLYFSILFLYNLNKFFFLYWVTILFLVLIGVVYILFLLFDINFLNHFFAYSTIVNVVSFLCIIMANF